MHGMIAVLSLMCIGVNVSHANTQKFDNAYLKWQAEQRAHDTRLQQKNNQINAQHYLGKPHVQTTSGSFNHGKVSINHASVVELQQLNGVGIKKAQAIIDYRQQYGRFKSIQDLKHVKGIGPKFLEKNLEKLSL